MGVPILKQGDCLVISIQSALRDEELLDLRDRLGHLTGKHRAHGVIVDLTMIDVLDSFATRTLRSMAHVTRLRGAETVIVGIQPDVAFAMVQLGLGLDGIATALDLEQALELLNHGARRHA